jgi:hypothetical protein
VVLSLSTSYRCSANQTWLNSLPDFLKSEVAEYELTLTSRQELIKITGKSQELLPNISILPFFCIKAKQIKQRSLSIIFFGVSRVSSIDSETLPTLTFEIAGKRHVYMFTCADWLIQKQCLFSYWLKQYKGERNVVRM